MKPNDTTRDELSAHLRSLEEALLDPAVRSDSKRVAALLAEEFQEFGSSGTVWSRQAIIESLATEEYRTITLEDFKCDWIADNVALVTYRSVRTDLQSSLKSKALRSSLWIEESGAWKMRFHQGTRTS